MTTPLAPPICYECKHFHGEDVEGLTCDAFPDGIPFEIITSEFDHNAPYPGDHGIQFESIESSTNIVESQA